VPKTDQLRKGEAVFIVQLVMGLLLFVKKLNNNKYLGGLI
jgi:hypothetical protein